MTTLSRCENGGSSYRRLWSTSDEFVLDGDGERDLERAVDVTEPVRRCPDFPLSPRSRPLGRLVPGVLSLLWLPSLPDCCDSLAVKSCSLFAFRGASSAPALNAAVASFFCFRFHRSPHALHSSFWPEGPFRHSGESVVLQLTQYLTPGGGALIAFCFSALEAGGASIAVATSLYEDSAVMLMSVFRRVRGTAS